MGRNCEEFFKKVQRFFIAKITINLAGFAHKLDLFCHFLNLIKDAIFFFLAKFLLFILIKKAGIIRLRLN